MSKFEIAKEAFAAIGFAVSLMFALMIAGKLIYLIFTA